MDFFLRRLMSNARVELRRPDGVRTERLDLVGEGFVQALNDRHHEHNGHDADADAENRQRRAQFVSAHRFERHPGGFAYISKMHSSKKQSTDYTDFTDSKKIGAVNISG